MLLLPTLNNVSSLKDSGDHELL